MKNEIPIGRTICSAGTCQPVACARLAAKKPAYLYQPSSARLAASAAASQRVRAVPCAARICSEHA
ncbi:hypothetical protein [Pseudoduganella umbonata]|uniref:Uncharacterized protein n=1 Tax=Pseudoduganella umbonata TaxID=864828 RepID=A0A7W5E6G4_9BURK|nr:hypothetical protein [Pseudoduganella umbonata]MBB3219572.1 hypothetical protein [Pseudoduganella umbonata]